MGRHGASSREPPCNIFLGADSAYFDMEKKYERFKAADSTAFIDPDGYEKHVAERDQAFRTKLKKQMSN